MLRDQFHNAVLVTISSSDTTSIIASKIQQIINALPEYTASVLTNVITVTSSVDRVEITPVFKPYSTGVVGTVAVTQIGDEDTPQIFTLTISQKASSSGVIQLVLNGSSVYVDTKKIDGTDIKSDYILILYGKSMNMRNWMFATYNSPRRRDYTVGIYCVSKNESDSIRLAGYVDYYLSKNMHELSKYGLRCAEPISTNRLSDNDTYGYSGTDSSFCYVVTYRGFVIV